jgi:hypothetical protein
MEHVVAPAVAKQRGLLGVAIGTYQAGTTAVMPVELSHEADEPWVFQDSSVKISQSLVKRHRCRRVRRRRQSLGSLTLNRKADSRRASQRPAPTPGCT